MSNRPRRFRHYDEEFKRSAVQLCLKGERTVAELAEELGVSTGSLYGWRSQFLDESEGRLEAEGDEMDGASIQELAAELKRLRKENAHLRTQREILKKAATILGEDPRNSMG